MTKKIIPLYIFFNILIASGGFDHGTAAGKGNWDISFTWNPFNYFKQGQSYVILGYGLTERLDMHGYYSSSQRRNDNYYGGFSYQFYGTKWLDLSTAIGIRKYKNKQITHFFVPQILYTVRLSEQVSVAGSFVEIRNQDLEIREGIAKDIFLMGKIYENKKYEINITLGAFKPVFWEPKSSNWYPTYSLDIKIKK